MRFNTLTLASVAALIAAGPVLAQTADTDAEAMTTGDTDAIEAAAQATAATDLNIRSGPGPMYDVLGVIPAEGSAAVRGCLEDGPWCEVEFDGTMGWSYAEYLAVEAEDEFVALSTRPQSVSIETVTYTDEDATRTEQNAGAAAGGTIGALVGAAVGGPVGAAVAGGILGTAAGAAAVDPVEETVTYVQSNPVDPVYLDGEVVVGAGVPDTIQTYEIPDADYGYLNINGQNVLVQQDGQIVAVLR